MKSRWLIFISAACLSAFTTTPSRAQSIDLYGTISYQYYGSLLTLNAQYVENYNPSYTRSGTLALQLWATSLPYYSGYIYGYKLGESTIGTLQGGYYFSNISRTTTFYRPPDGSYYMTMILAEWNGYAYEIVDHAYISIETFGIPIIPATLVLNSTTRNHANSAISGQSIGVSANVAWSASKNMPWITITGGSSGSGNGTITYRIEANSGPARSGIITVTGGGITRTFTINQERANVLSIAPSTRSHSRASISGQTITVSANVPWKTSEGYSWITITGGASGANNGTITYNITANNDAARSGSILVTGGGLTRIFTVNQEGPSLLIGPRNRRHSRNIALDQRINVTANVSWTAVATSSWVTITGERSGTGNGTISYNIDANEAIARSGDIRVFGEGLVQTFTISQVGTNIVTISDYNGDGKTDLPVFNPPNGAWYIRAATTQNVLAWNNQWGWSTAKPVPGDYDGDAASDLAVFDTQGGYWYIKSLMNGVLSWKNQWGWSTAKPVPGDYDGDGAWDQAVFDTQGGYWYIKSLMNGVLSWKNQWGWSTAKPVPGDYDGDGAWDQAVFDTQGGYWYIKSLMNRVLSWKNQWGWSTAKPVPGDFDGDGSFDQAVFDTHGGYWYIKSLSKGVITWGNQWGWNTAKPVAGDFDGDGIYDLAVVDTATGRWYIKSLDGRILAWNVDWGWPRATFPALGD